MAKVGLWVSLAVQAVFLVLGTVQGRALRENSGFAYVFWILCGVSVGLKCATALIDPGFCALAEAQSLDNSLPGSAPDPASNHPMSPSTSSNSPFESVLKVDQSISKVDPKLPKQHIALEPLSPKSADSPVPDEVDATSNLDVSLEASSSCKESVFRDLPDDHMEDFFPRTDAISDPVVSLPQRKTDEVEILIPDSQLIPEPTTTVNIEIMPGLRYCTLCNIDQPLRAKHCSICHRCVARYDHHCPWLSICIGERNHCLFLCYLYLQILTILVGICAGVVELADEKNWDYKWYLRVGLVVAAAGVGVGLSSLAGYQTMLVTCNLTTWEYRSWDKVTYLQGRPRSLKSPFSQGCWRNLRFVLKGTCVSTPIEWKIATSRSRSVPA